MVKLKSRDHQLEELTSGCQSRPRSLTSVFVVDQDHFASHLCNSIISSIKVGINDKTRIHPHDLGLAHSEKKLEYYEFEKSVNKCLGQKDQVTKEWTVVTQVGETSLPLLF